MAEISFKGFVQKHEGNKPWVIAEGHQKKNPDGTWFTASRTYHTVWLPEGVDSLNEGDFVRVVGRQITPPKKGDYKSQPVVYANEIELVSRAKREDFIAATVSDEPF